MKPPENGFGSFVRHFELAYGDACVQLADHVKERYPEITRKGRRTARALRNICLFIWCYTRNGDEDLIPALFDASVLLSAQDDYYDNPRIPASEKDAFCSAVNRALRASSFQPATGQTRQIQDLMSLWSDVARPIHRASSEVGSYWTEKACRLNEAMAAENRAMRRTIGFDEYMETAVHSIGMDFLWSTYFVHKDVPLTAIRQLDPILLLGARIARLSNDIASYRQRKNTRNAVILLGGGDAAERRVIELMAQESRVFRERLDGLDVGEDVKRVILRSIEFLKQFYQRADFDETVLW